MTGETIAGRLWFPVSRRDAPEPGPAQTS